MIGKLIFLGNKIQVLSFQTIIKVIKYYWKVYKNTKGTVVKSQYKNTKRKSLSHNLVGV